MQVTRAAIVKYDVTPARLISDDADMREEVPVALSVAAHISRRLLTCDPENAAWPDAIAAPLFKRSTLDLRTEKAVVAHDGPLWNEWSRDADHLEQMRRQWSATVKQLGSTVPRKKLEALVEQLLPEPERQVARFGQQVDGVLSLPVDSASLERCRSAIEALGQWVDVIEMMDMAAQFYRLSARITETRDVLLEDLRIRYAGLVEEIRAELLDEASLGLCIPEWQVAFLEDTLFVFDGQFTPGEMRKLMAEHLVELEHRMTQAALALDSQREGAEAERLAEIPGRVRALVWRRDLGRCAACGATEDLEFTHIIPRSLGGASTAGNLQVICVSCNEKKGAQVARVKQAPKRGGADRTRDLFGDPGEENGTT